MAQYVIHDVTISEIVSDTAMPRLYIFVQYGAHEPRPVMKVIMAKK